MWKKFHSAQSEFVLYYNQDRIFSKERQARAS